MIDSRAGQSEDCPRPRPLHVWSRAIRVLKRRVPPCINLSFEFTGTNSCIASMTKGEQMFTSNCARMDTNNMIACSLFSSLTKQRIKLKCPHVGCLP